MKSPIVTLYGQFHGHWSNAGVSRGLAAGLHANGVSLKLVGEQGLYECMWTLPRRVAKRPLDMQLCAGTPITEGTGLFVGYSIQSPPLLRGHDVRVGAFICESEDLPGGWGAAARDCDLVVVPSRWVRDAYVKAGVDPLRVIVVPHGLHPIYRQVASLGGSWAPAVTSVDGSRPQDGLAFLHVAGARDFLDRKGTPQLVEAFARVFDPTRGRLRHQKALLVIRTPANDKLMEMAKATGAAFLYHFDWHDSAMPPETMHDYLGGSWAAVVQPSRAEAFGIVPCEARAMGLPVILTHCSGQKAHAEPSDVVVAHGASAPIAVNGIPNGRAPSVSAGAIADALERFALRAGEHAVAARTRAVGYAERYSWAAVTAPLAVRLRELNSGSGRTLAGRMIG